jgi:hypothetical protein
MVLAKRLEQQVHLVLEQLVLKQSLELLVYFFQLHP